MAGVKISNLPAIVTPAAGDEFPVVQGGVTYKETVTQLGTLLLLLSGGTMTGFLTLNADPTAALHAATKQYVDAVAEGLHVHGSCRLGTTANLNAVYSNGASGVGATLTNNGALAALSLDGTAVSANDRILVKDQTNQFENGIYTVTTVGDGATAWVLTRATDYDQASEVDQGDYVYVRSGTVNGATSWVQTNAVNTMGTDNIIWDQFGADVNVVITSIQESSYIYSADTGAADAYVATLAPAITAYNAGQQVLLNVANANTGASTINVNGVGAANIKLEDGTDPSAGDIIATQLAWLVYDGTNFILQNPARGLGITTVVTGTSDALEVNRVFVSNNAAAVTLTLPTTAKVGDWFQVDGLGAGGWVIAQNAGQQIHSPGASTTSGATGSITSASQYDSVRIRCVVADNTFVVESLVGSPTFA